MRPRRYDGAFDVFIAAQQKLGKGGNYIYFFDGRIKQTYFFFSFNWATVQKPKIIEQVTRFFYFTEDFYDKSHEIIDFHIFKSHAKVLCGGAGKIFIFIYF